MSDRNKEADSTFPVDRSETQDTTLREGTGEELASRPLYVDLDGSLVSTDTLWESIWAYFRAEPVLAVWQLPLWLARGRAELKQALSETITLDSTRLPYREEVVDYIREARRGGRTVVLSTAAHQRVAESVAEHLGLFDDVLASSDGVNLKGSFKLAAIEKHCGALRGTGQGHGRFEYIGNDRSDLPIWRQAERITVVGPTPSLLSRLRSLGGEPRIFPVQRAGLRTWAKAIRVHQWAKNALIFIPLLLAHELADWRRDLAVLITFASFCGIASATYLLNDLLDIGSDRQHPTKRTRPIAAGVVSIPLALLFSASLLIGSFGASILALSWSCTAMLFVYLILTLSYSFYFKQLLVIDVLVLAGFYTHRVLTGGVAAGTFVSPWLLAFSTFFFLSLALLKRYVETRTLKKDQREVLSGRAYESDDVALLETMGVSSGFISILVLALYVSSEYVEELYRTPELLWLLCPVMLYWVTRVWFLARRGQVAEDPVLFATTDPASYVAGAILGMVMLAAALL